MNINEVTEQSIQKRAFEIYLERGCQPGHALDDWLQAEFELTHLPLRIVRLNPIGAARETNPVRRRQRSNRTSIRTGR